MISRSQKVGDKVELPECGNYRPISVIPAVAKTLRKNPIYDKLNSYMY